MPLLSTKEDLEDLENRVQHFGDLKKRLIISSGVIACLILLIYFSQNLYSMMLVTFFDVVLCVIGLLEYAKIAQKKGVYLKKITLFTMGILFILSLPISAKIPNLLFLPWMVLLLSFFLFFIQEFRRIEGSVSVVATNAFAMIYIVVPFGLLLSIIYPNLMEHAPSADGRLWVAYLIAVIKGTDMGAYFGGKLFGKRALASLLSPKKTVEGAIIGFFTGIIISLLFSLYSFSMHSVIFKLDLIHAILLGIILSVMGQFGDLSESLLKRDAEIKDSNNLPGLGGVLDTFDSLLFGIPTLYIYLYFFV